MLFTYELGMLKKVVLDGCTSQNALYFSFLLSVFLSFERILSACIGLSG